MLPNSGTVQRVRPITEPLTRPWLTLEPAGLLAADLVDAPIGEPHALDRIEHRPVPSVSTGSRHKRTFVAQFKRLTQRPAFQNGHRVGLTPPPSSACAAKGRARAEPRKAFILRFRQTPVEGQK
jgi:hypothetical protein